jgi:hypothetical protein
MDQTKYQINIFGIWKKKLYKCLVCSVSLLNNYPKASSSHDTWQPPKVAAHMEDNITEDELRALYENWMESMDDSDFINAVNNGVSGEGSTSGLHQGNDPI